MNIVDITIYDNTNGNHSSFTIKSYKDLENILSQNYYDIKQFIDNFKNEDYEQHVVAFYDELERLGYDNTEEFIWDNYYDLDPLPDVIINYNGSVNKMILPEFEKYIENFNNVKFFKKPLGNDLIKMLSDMLS